MSLLDTFPFFNELELLEIRLYELAPIVRKFVLVEANQTHQGKPKKLYFEENKSEFSNYNITHLVCDLPCIDNGNGLSEAECWRNEKTQRDQILQGLKGCTFVDYIIVSDLDEIPRREAVQYVDRPSCLAQRLSYYYLNMIADETWYRGLILPYNQLLKHTPSWWRSMASPYNMNTIQNAGWHASYLGGTERILEKINSFAHTDLKSFADEEWIDYSIHNQKDLYKRPSDFHVISVDDSFPHAIRDNPITYRKLFHEAD